eukprot:UN33246
MTTAVELNKHSHNTSDALKQIVLETHRVVHCQYVTLYYVNDNNISVAWTDDPCIDRKAVLKNGEGIVGQVAKRGRSVRVTQERVTMSTCPEYKDYNGTSRINIIATPILNK